MKMNATVPTPTAVAPTQQNLTGIDVGKFVFACLIPFLHISFGGSPVKEIFSQYFARLGVPFFFVVAGMLLAKSVRMRSSKEALSRFEKKNGRLLLTWIILYSPIMVVYEGLNLGLAQKVVFQTPGYLWYLTAMLVAAIPFCLVRGRRVLYVVAGVLYVAGTLFGDTYQWLTGGMPAWYEAIFLTTRNGLLFALPMLCVGERIATGETPRHLPVKLVASVVLLVGEIFLVRSKASPDADCSMYLLLPVVIYYVVAGLRTWNPQIDTRFIRGASTAIYLLQYGIIAVGKKAFEILSFPMHIGGWIIYVAVIAGGCIVYALFRRNKWLSKLFG
ncbi:MAG: hypothetical protein IJO76_00955 [Clostridia bacterium]|nr:hypothetical protein [Clostridia bacterium]